MLYCERHQDTSRYEGLEWCKPPLNPRYAYQRMGAQLWPAKHRSCRCSTNCIVEIYQCSTTTFRANHTYRK